ncbi:TerC family protein [Pseudotenacibaculum haliotis]|uniref:TerC family protein n=2 Tax=Bacteria TaxID=2 RepID=A0ABW5LXB4_9FLAO
MEIFLQVDTWVALLTLTFLEIVLGVDNIIFISISANKLPEQQRKKATLLGLSLAMITRVALLLSVSYLVALKDPIFTIDTSWLQAGVSIQSIILFLGGLFLLYKSTKEIREKMEESVQKHDEPTKIATFKSVIFQIILIDIVFSFDSILTAVGMTNGIEGALTIMVIAVVISMIIMMGFANPVNKFVSKNPTIQMLALSFLILIGFMLIAEGAHLSHTVIFNNSIGSIPKGYLYFAIAFSLGVEFLNMRIVRNNNKKS